MLLQALKSWGALDKNYAYKANLISARYRGYAKGPGGGLWRRRSAGRRRADRAGGHSQVAAVARAADVCGA